MLIKPNKVNKNKKQSNFEIIKEEPIILENIIPGRKVNLIGINNPKLDNKIFTICQKLSNGNISVLGDNGLILYVKPENIKII